MLIATLDNTQLARYPGSFHCRVCILKDILQLDSIRMSFNARVSIVIVNAFEILRFHSIPAHLGR